MTHLDNDRRGQTYMAITERLAKPSANPAVLGGAAFVLAILIVVAANWDVRKGENGGTGPALVTAIICLLLAAALFGFVVPRASNVERTTLILGIVAFVSIAVFWSGITPVLAAASVATAARLSAPSRKALIAQVLGVVATVAALAITLAQTHLF